ncbi:transposase [Bacillus fungorum]|uniref:DUF6262 family protein n=1 Tax=Bacillus fungorum TaxID=2039284 RepID=UPI003394D52B
MADFVGWLRHPYASLSVASITPVKYKKTEKTVKSIITTVTNFYDYLYCNEEIFVSQHLMDLYDDYLYEIINELDIETLRQQQTQTFTSKQIKRERSDSNKDVIIESLKRRIKKVEEENRQLRNQLKVAYADVYKQI